MRNSRPSGLNAIAFTATGTIQFSPGRASQTSQLLSDRPLVSPFINVGGHTQQPVLGSTDGPSNTRWSRRALCVCAIMAVWRAAQRGTLDGQAQFEGSEPGRYAICGNFFRTLLSNVARGRLRCAASS